MSFVERWKKVVAQGGKNEPKNELKSEPKSDDEETKSEDDEIKIVDRLIEKKVSDEMMLPKSIYDNNGFLNTEKYKFDLKSLRDGCVGIDPCNKESYLLDSEFEDVFSMSREDFTRLRKWKQTQLKKKVGLF